MGRWERRPGSLTALQHRKQMGCLQSHMPNSTRSSTCNVYIIVRYNQA